jgi:hypothetical protein
MNQDLKVIKLLGNTVTGTSVIQGAVVDMKDYDEVMFAASISTAAANNGLKCQQGDESDGSDAADVLGSLNLCNGTGTSLLTAWHRPKNRYVRPAVVRGTTTVIDAVFAILKPSRSLPQTNIVANAQNAKKIVSPINGTA